MTIRNTLSYWSPFVITVLSAILFDGLFWQRSIGLNLTLFVVLVSTIILVRYSWKGLSGPARLSLIGCWVAAAMVLVHHSAIAMFGAIVALALSSALAHEGRLRSVFHGVLQFVGSVALAPIRLYDELDVLAATHRTPRVGWRWARLTLVPGLVLLLFVQLYRAGNPKFDNLTAGFMNGLMEILEELWKRFLTPHAFFFLLGLLACAALLHRFAPPLVLDLEQRCSDLLLSVRRHRPHWLSPRSMDPLERERRMGVILLVAVNLLLFVVNVIDIGWVWIGFEVPEGFSLKQFVHEGTWMLIISILLSMIILMHLFRGNLNFYSRNPGLKRLAVLWIAQNFVLGISVFLRNYHYISFHGLAYKRIGVIVFLALVLVGLVTLFIKIRDRKSLYYLARVNGWAAFIMLIGLTTVDWDSFIVRTNLRHMNAGEIDIDNYLAMSDKVLPMLYANFDLVEAQMAQHRQNRVRWVDHLDPDRFRKDLDAKRDRFVDRYAAQDLLESNLADRLTMKALGGASNSSTGSP